MKVILGYVHSVNSLKNIELKNRKNWTKNKKVVNFYETSRVFASLGSSVYRNFSIV